jgi:hypothetical protein
MRGAIVVLYFIAGFLIGENVERGKWEKANMGSLCNDGYQWACELSPICTMRAVYCFPYPKFMPLKLPSQKE